MTALADKFQRGGEVLPMLHALSAAVLDSVGYAKDRTDSSTSAEDALHAGEGVWIRPGKKAAPAVRPGLPKAFCFVADRVDQ